VDKQSGHSVTISLTEYGVVPKFTCHEPEGAMCRVTCQNGCGSWTPDHEEKTAAALGSDRKHKLVPYEYGCNFVEWMESCDPIGDAFVGTWELVTDNKVQIEYTGEGYQWHRGPSDNEPTTKGAS